MRTSFFVILLMFAGAALMGTSAFAGSCGCKRACGASTEKKNTTKAADSDGGCGGCGGCGGGKTCTGTKSCDGGGCGGGSCGGCGGCEGCGGGCKEATKKEVAAEAKLGDTYVVVVTDMCCAGCAKSVCSKIKKIEGVADAKADVEKGTITVTMKEGKALDKAAVETALKGTDWGVTSCDKQVKEEPKKEEPKKDEAATPKKEEAGEKKATN